MHIKIRCDHHYSAQTHDLESLKLNTQLNRHNAVELMHIHSSVTRSDCRLTSKSIYFHCWSHTIYLPSFSESAVYSTKNIVLVVHTLSLNWGMLKFKITCVFTLQAANTDWCYRLT